MVPGSLRGKSVALGAGPPSRRVSGVAWRRWSIWFKFPFEALVDGLWIEVRKFGPSRVALHGWPMARLASWSRPIITCMLEQIFNIH
jgi:hypothetical protein